MNFLHVFIYSLIAGGSALLGTYLVMKKEEWCSKNSVFLISFGSGVMLAIAFLHLIPDAVQLHHRAVQMVFGGFLTLYMLQQVMMFHACHDEACHVHRLSVLSTIGLTLHSLLDGITIGVGFEMGPALGFMLTLAIILHKLPDGITITGILLHAKRARTSVIAYSGLVALATPIGAVGAFLFLQKVPISTLGLFLAFTAGSFLYLAAADLLPETHKQHNRANAVFFFLGIGLVAMMGLVLG